MKSSVVVWLQPDAKAEGCVHDDPPRADKLRKGSSFRVGTWNIDSLTGRAGELVEVFNQSINQREICRAPLYETSRSANSSQWYARSKSTLLSRFLNVLVSVMSWRSEGRVFQVAGPQ